MSNRLHKFSVAVGSSVAIGLMSLGTSVFAQVADSDIASTTEALTSSVKDNILGVLTGPTGTTLVLIAAVPIAILFVYRLMRRFIGR